MFDRWCSAQKAESKEDLRQLILLEDFVNCLPESVAVYLNEQEVRKHDEAAVLADKYVLIHNRVPDSRWVNHYNKVNDPKTKQQAGRGDKTAQLSHSASNNPSFANKTDITCFYCRRTGHKMSACVALKNKHSKSAKSVGLVTSCGIDLSSVNKTGIGSMLAADVGKGAFDSDYAPFVTDGIVTLAGESCSVPVRILRDTGAAQSFLLSGVLPLSDSTATGTHVLVRGLEMTPVQVPLHRVHLSSSLITGEVVVGVRQSLPVPGISFIMGNGLAGGKMWDDSVVSPPVVLSVPEPPLKPEPCLQQHPDVFPVCAVTRAMAKRGLDSDFVSLEDTFLFAPHDVEDHNSSQTTVEGDSYCQG